MLLANLLYNNLKAKFKKTFWMNILQPVELML